MLSLLVHALLVGVVTLVAVVNMRKKEAEEAAARERMRGDPIPI
jgi:hypothetical protein